LYTEVAGTAARTFDLAGSNSGNNEFHGSIGNSTNGSVLALTKSGNGTWILSGTNTYSGSTTISAGRLEISGVLGGGTNYIGNIANAGTLIVSGSSTQTWSGVVSGNGTFIKDGSGTLTLSGINTFPVLRTTNGVTRFTRVEAIIPTAANYLYTGGMNDLAFSGSTVISSLYLNNVSQPAGVYNASSHPAFFSGSGSLIIGRPTALTWASTSSGSVGYWTNSLWSPTPSGGLLYPAYYKEDANLTNAIASGAYTVIYDSTLPNELDDVVLSNSGAGTAVLVVTNSTLRASTLIGPGSRLQIENGGVVSSYYVSTENMFAGTNGVLSISSGGIFDVTTSAYIGNAVINVRGTVNVSAGGVMKSGDLTIGYGIGTTATNNSLIVSGGGVVSNAAVYVGYGSGGAGTASGNRLTVSNATVNMSGALMIAHAGNSTINNMMTVDQGGVVNMGLNTLTVCGTADYGFPVYGTNNGLIITNNGMVRCGSVTINGSESYYGNLWINNGGSLVSSNATCAGNIQINGGVNVSTWNLTTNTLAINSKSGVMRVDGSGVVGGAVVANVGLLQLNNTDPSYTARLILTNGAAMSATSLWISTQNAPAGYNALSVIGGAASSVLSLAGSDVNVGVALDGGNTKNSLGTLTIAGGVVTNAGALKVGTRLAGGGYGEAGANTVYITDGGKLYTTNTSYIGYNSGSGDGVRLTHNNKMFVSGSGSLWDANGRNVTVGGSGGSNPPTNCVLSVSSGGQVLNVGVLAIGTGSAVDNILALNPAGLVSATSATIRASNALEVVLNNAISTQAGRLDVSGNLNISNSKLNITIVGNPTANAIIATYGSLTGAFAVTNGLPDKYRLDMHYQNQNQIAIVYTAAGTVIHFR
jgi:autotransporter-associated beta strand protein